MTGFRLAAGGTGIDRGRVLAFRFDGRRYEGFAGDTLASALLANGVGLMARSFKLHRPRGVVTAGPEEPSALVTVGHGARRTPNRPATTVLVTDGLEAFSQNRWPSLRLDALAVNSLLARFLPAGFYYKSFMWPAAFWERIYEPVIRCAAGLGRIADGPDPDAYETVHAHCDVLVIGGGPSGLAAARAAQGRVLLIDAGGAEARQLHALAQPNLTVMTRTTAIAAYDHRLFAAVEEVGGTIAQRLWLIRAGRTILATGATERLIAFPGNDRPGVMLAGSVARYLTRYGVACGRRAALFVNNDTAYETAAALAEAGIEIAAIIDSRDTSAAADRAESAGLTVLRDAEVTATAGGHALSGISVRERRSGATRRIACDLLAVSGGYAPNIQLAQQARQPTRWRDDIAAFVCDGDAALTPVGAAAGEIDTTTRPLWQVRAPGKAFVDLQHDVTTDDVRLAHREGYSDIEHMKRYTTHHMATDQGRIGGLVGAAVLAEARGVAVPEAGIPAARPFAVPASFGVLAGAETGRHFKPERRLALHGWHQANGAVFVRIGLWLRPLVYSPTGDTSWGPVVEEARAVRTGVGLSDVSSLGKIDVQGPDAAQFLDRIYANTVSTLPVGRCRYGLMLREDGIVFDDGTIARLGADHFLLSTTTAKAEDALAHLEWHAAAVWPDLDVSITNVADHWAQFALAGPQARDVLARLVDRDLSTDAFAFMATGAVTIAGVRGRLFRISFSGERAYEIAVPARHATAVWMALLQAGAPFGIRPYGLDALNLLRIEKGHIAGSELNGQTTPQDLGLEKLLKKSGDFVGRTLLGRPALQAAGRLQLVGVTPVSAGDRLRTGAHFVGKGFSRTDGFITASCMTADGDGWCGLGLLADGRSRHGEIITATSPLHGEEIAVRIASPHRHDPENARVRA